MPEHHDAAVPPVATPPGVGVGPAVAPSSYLLHRDRRGLAYKGLVDPVNQRLTVKHLHFGDAAALAADVLRAARAHDVGKVLLYAGAGQWQELLAEGFALEGILEGFFAGQPAYLMGYLLSNDRLACGDLEREQSVLEAALGARPAPPPPLGPEYALAWCGPELAAELAAVYAEVFTSFPSPLHEADFVAELIGSGEGIFRAVLQGGRIATRFSLARSASYGMNQALRKAGYAFGGRLRCNSHIMGGYENMNLWTQRAAVAGAH